MKSIRMHRDFDFHHGGQPGAPNTSYRAGETYSRVPEAQVSAIVEAGAGEVIDDGATEAETTSETETAPRGRRR